MSTRSFFASIISAVALLGTIDSFHLPEYPKSVLKLFTDGQSRTKSAPGRLNNIFQEGVVQSEDSSPSHSSHDEHCVWWHLQPFLDIEADDGSHRFYCRQTLKRFGVEIYYSPTFDSDFEIITEKVGDGPKEKNINDIIESLKIQRELDDYHYFAKLSSVSLQDDTCYTLLQFCASVSLHTVFKDEDPEIVEEFGHLKQMILGSFPFYLAQLIDMMSILDAHEVFHGGLNFNNVRIRENGYLKLAGFENSFKPDKTKRKMIYTKSPWPAPELMLFGSTTAASNWYSLGAFVYELLTDKSFIPSDVFDREDLDSNLKMIIGDLASKDSHRRYLRTLRLKQMQYFKDIDWEKLRSGELKAPISFLFND